MLALILIEWYLILVGVLTTKYHMFAQDFTVYQCTIVHASRSYSGEGWVTYDMCYCRNAAFRKSLHWSQVDFTLYNETFTGKAKITPWCKYCVSEHHKSHECLYDPQSVSPSSQGNRTDAPMPFYLYNSHSGNQCCFRNCKYNHICSRCHGSHPVVACTYLKPPPSKHPHTDNRDSRPIWVLMKAYV